MIHIFSSVFLSQCVSFQTLPVPLTTHLVITLTIKSLAGDLLSVVCSPTDSLLDLKRTIAVAAASQLGQHWPEHQQRLISLSIDDDDVEDGSGSGSAVGGGLDEASWQDDTMSLHGLGIGDGDMLAMLIEDQVCLATQPSPFFLT